MNPAAYYLSSLETNIPYVPTAIEMGNGQTWDSRNLNTSTYSDGTLIPKINSNSLWIILNTGACRFYNNDSTNGSIYGRLYNYWAVNGIYDYASLFDPLLRKDIAPAGWRVATIADWQSLSDYATALIPIGSVGSKLKEVGTSHWQPTNNGATDVVGFKALPGGFVSNVSGAFSSKNTAGYFWPLEPGSDYSLSLAYNSTALTFRTDGSGNRGYSVRLIKKDLVIPGFTTTLGTALAKSVPTGGYIPTSYTETPTEIGIVFGTSINPNIIAQSGNKRIYEPTGLGTYSINLTGLSSDTTYHIRAYAKIISGTAYADNVTFTTRNGIATLTTNTVTDITGTTATCGGNITDDGGDTITAIGVCWNTTGSPTISNSKTTNGSGTGAFTSNMTSLSPDQIYYVRAYSTNSITTSYGNEVNFTTLVVPITPILDLYPTNVHHAYSLRQLRTLYTGACLRVRRTTITPATSTTFDVGFDSVTGVVSFNSPLTNRVGDASAATTLGQFAEGTVDGLTAQPIYVVTWYDQSTNISTKNPTQTLESRQPRLVNVVGGVATLEKSGGKVAVRFIRASNTNLFRVDTTANINNMSSYFVGAYVVSSALGGAGYSLGNATNRFYFPNTSGANVYAAYGATVTAITLQTGFNLNRHLYELISPTVGSTTLLQGWENGVAKGIFGIVSASTAQIVIGNVGGGALYYDGFVQEVIGYQSNLNRIEKETNINSYWKIY